MPLDYKTTEKSLYQPKVSPSMVDVHEMVFIAVDGKGDPNTSAEYAAAIEVLYGISYTVKMSNKAILEYVVPPLEGLWNGDPNAGKSNFEWTALIRQPSFVTDDVFSAAKAALAKKKPGLDTSKARLVTITEGLCVQAMHVGSYDSEPATIAAMERYAVDNGCVIDLGARRHHEIYLSDPRKVAPESLKTVIRHPVRRVG